jgi:4-amino-4-deoxy-L-arabinose transferase-like glycosyltransferase
MRVPKPANLLPILLLAYALRVYHLDFQSLWSDEGISLLRSSQPFGQMLRDMPVEHVPGYFVLLHFWLPIAGTGDFALRYLSLFPSVLAIAIVYRLATDLGSSRAGLIAAVLLAANSFQIWYAQEARMYSWLLMTGVAATWFLWRLLAGRKWAIPFGGYVLSLTGTIYLHAYGFLLPLAHIVFAVIWLAYRREPRVFLRWVAATSVVILLFLPWLPHFLGIFGFPGYRLDLDPFRLPWQYLVAYTVGDPMPEPWRGWLPVLLMVLALAGTWAWWRRDRLAAWLLICSAVVPLVGAFALALRKADYHERYLIYLSASLFLLVAGGFGVLDPRSRRADLGRKTGSLRLAVSRLLAAALLAGLLAADGLAVHRLYADSDVQKADYRSVAHRVEQLQMPGDVIVADGLDPQQVFMHYYRGQLPVYDIRRVEDGTDAEVDAALTAVTAGSRRVWLLRHYHPEGPIEGWLARHGWLAGRTYHSSDGLTLSVYGLPALPQVDLPADTPFGPDLKLTGITVAGGADHESGLTFHAGDLLGITTAWEVLAPPPSLSFSLRLLDSAGRAWLAEDYAPQDGFAPTIAWQPGTLVSERHGLLLPADLPPGRYEVCLMLYEPGTGVPVGASTPNGTCLVAANVLPAVVPPDPAGLPISVRLNERFGDHLELLGYDVAPRPLRAGQEGTLTLWWRAADRSDRAEQVRLEILDGRGQVVARQIYPLSQAQAGIWQPGQVVQGRYAVALDPALASGSYALNLSLVGSNGQSVGPPLALGSVTVEARPRTFRLPRVSRPLEMRLGDSILLRGYDLALPAEAGDKIRLTLYWQAAQRVSTGYKVFVHLVDDSGRIVAQSDAVPAGSRAPTESWLAGEVVTDRHKLDAPPAGHYRLLVGLYDPVTGQRPPVYDAAGGPVPEDAIPLADVDLP